MFFDKSIDIFYLIFLMPFRDQLTLGEWLPESRMVKVARPGKFWHHMGVETDIGKCLYPEEAVYLIDTVRIALKFKYIEMPLHKKGLVNKMIIDFLWQKYHSWDDLKHTCD